MTTNIPTHEGILAQIGKTKEFESNEKEPSKEMRPTFEEAIIEIKNDF